VFSYTLHSHKNNFRVKNDGSQTTAVATVRSYGTATITEDVYLYRPMRTRSHQMVGHAKVKMDSPLDAPLQKNYSRGQWQQHKTALHNTPLYGGDGRRDENDEVRLIGEEESSGVICCVRSTGSSTRTFIHHTPHWLKRCLLTTTNTLRTFQIGTTFSRDKSAHVIVSVQNFRLNTIYQWSINSPIVQSICVTELSVILPRIIPLLTIPRHNTGSRSGLSDTCH